MLVAGSLLALLVMGFAVDGLLSAGDDKEDGALDLDAADDEALDDQSGVSSSALSDLLFSGTDDEDDQDPTDESDALPMAHTPLDTLDPFPEDTIFAGDTMSDPDAPDESHEDLADMAWDNAADSSTATDGFLEVEDLTELITGEEVAYVDIFDTDTDALILEFDGTADEAPEISIDLDTEEDAAIVLANGVPVTLVEGATDLTPDHIRVVMSGEAAPLGLPDDTIGADSTGTETPDVSATPGLPDLLETAPEPEPEPEINVGNVIDTGIDPATDSIDGNGNDEPLSDTGDDLLQGSDGVDVLDEGDNNDTLDGGSMRDLLFGGDGNDVAHGGAADDVLQGGMATNTLNGGSGDDLPGGTFSENGTDHDSGDVPWGGDGDDTILVGQGDTAHGGGGSDTFIGGGYVEDTELFGNVTDFDPVQDRIEVIFDPDLNPNPVLEVLDFADGSGADIILNGEVILSVTGAQGLNPNLIDLRAAA